MTVTVLNALLRPLIEDKLPAWVEPRWFASADDLYTMAPEAEIGWFDAYDLPSTHRAAGLAVRLKWLNTLAAGVDPFPLDLLRARCVTLTNGAGINAVTIAEYAVMGMLTFAKGFHHVLRAQDRREWLAEAPGKAELLNSRVLVLGAGEIGALVAERLGPFGAHVVKVRRHPGPGDLGTGEWRARLGEFDWIVVTVPSTPETVAMIGAAELAAMKPTAVLLNFARGAVIDQPALVEALCARRIGGAFLDVTDPEPLPADHPLWGLDNCIISMHLSGRSQTLMFQRSAARFLANLERYGRGEPLEHVVDLAAGY